MMTQEEVSQFLIVNNSLLPAEAIPYIKERLLTSGRANQTTLLCVQLKDPTISLILSILLGTLGIDRFYIGDIGLGIGKLLTGGGCGIWAIVDWFLIMKDTKVKNLKLLQQTVL